MNIDPVWIVATAVGLIGWFLRGMYADQKKVNEQSRENDREIYKELNRIEMSYWKDQCEQARKK